MNSLPREYKIFLLADQLSKGGAERSAAFLSNYLDKKNITVKIMIINDEIDYKYSGEILNLGKIRNNTVNYWNKLKRLVIFYRFIKRNKFDYIIDFRVKLFQYQEFLFALLFFKSKLIVTIHSYMIYLYFPQNKFLANRIYKKCHKIVTVSSKISSKIIADYNYKANEIQTIYNPVDLEYVTELSNKNLEFEYDYIVAIGRMEEDNVKQFDKLIDSYDNSILPLNNTKLVLLGDGVLRKKYELKVQKLKRENDIIFKGYVSNPYVFFKKAKFTVLSSKFEGFPMVLIESLSCETPVVAFDCFSGPSEIIRNNENGILVENQNFKKLTDAMNSMISNKELYIQCKQNAKRSVERFSIDNIGKKWLELMGIDL